MCADDTSFVSSHRSYQVSNPQQQLGRQLISFVAATLPVLFLGTGIFFTLTLIQTHLSHSKALEDSGRRISALEDELGELRRDQRRQVEDWGMGECDEPRERSEREEARGYSGRRDCVSPSEARRKLF